MDYFKQYIVKSLSKADEISSQESSEITIVIPAFNEPFILNTLQSLQNNKFERNVLVIIVVNYSVKASDATKEFNRRLYHVLHNWSKTNSTTNFSFEAIFVPDMPRKHAGAGLARKVGMDTAIDLFHRNKQENGIIVSLDADCKVTDNYLSAIYAQFRKDKSTQLVLLDFEHQKAGLPQEQLEAIINYEMYLHYFVLGCRWSGFPYAYHTVGSCFAVSAGTYVKQGGMNRKHAGEDFYFLHKLFPLENTRRLYNARVFPSSRVSNRVPFGTGPALKNILQDENPYLVYNFSAFNDLKPFYNEISSFYRNPERVEAVSPLPLQVFFKETKFVGKMHEARSNSSSELQFKKRMLRHFDAFQLVKYLNFAHETGYYKKIPANLAAIKVLEAFGKHSQAGNAEILYQLRELEKIIRPR